MLMPNYLDYEKMGEMNPIANSLAMGQVNQARQWADNDAAKQVLDNRKTELSNLFDEANNPTRLLQGVSTLKQTDLGNEAAGLVNNIKRATNADDIVNGVNTAKLMQAENPIKVATAKAYQMAMDPDPAISGEGYRQLANIEPYIKMRQESKYKMDEEAPKIAGRERVANIMADASKHNAGLRGAGANKVTPAQGAAWALKDGIDIAGPRIDYLIQLATADGDDQAVASYVALGDQVRKQIAAKQADSKPGITINDGKVSVTPAAPKAPVPTLDPRAGNGPVTPKPGGNAPPQHTYADVAKMYPGVPEAQVRQAYKSKFGVDLK